MEFEYRKKLNDEWKAKHLNSIKKSALQILILNKSPRLRYEPMQPGARYRTIFNSVFLDGERLDNFVACKICEKPITTSKFGITGMTQHYRIHLTNGQCPFLPSAPKMWDGKYDVRHMWHQDGVEHFVVPIRLPPEAYTAIERFRSVQLYLDVSKEVNSEKGGTKKEKTEELPTEIEVSRASDLQLAPNAHPTKAIPKLKRHRDRKGLEGDCPVNHRTKKIKEKKTHKRTKKNKVLTEPACQLPHDPVPIPSPLPTLVIADVKEQTA